MSQFSTDSSFESAFQPVPNLLGVVNDSTLRKFGLGIVEELNLLCCALCRPITILALPTVHSHVHGHDIVNNRKYTKAKIQEECKSYDIYTGYLPDFPKPAEPAVPYKALITVTGHACKLCAQMDEQRYLFSKSALHSHFQEVHPEIQNDLRLHVREASFQNFCSGHNAAANYFEVSTAPDYDLLSQPEDTTELESYITQLSTAHEMAAALSRNYRPVYHPVSDGDSLKDSHHTILLTGWSRHVADKDPKFLVELVAVASPEDPLDRIAKAAQRTFKTALEAVGAAAEPVCFALKDDGSGANLKPMTKLARDAQAEYGRTLQRWCVFVMRLYRLHEAKDERYQVTFLAAQEEVCRLVEDYCTNRSDEYKGSVLVLQLANCFWAPGSLQAYAHLLDDKMDDPTARFSALINLFQDGSFQTPRNISHNVVQLKYLMRSVLFLWSQNERKTRIADKTPSQLEDDPLAEVLKPIAKFISKRYVTPFSNVCTVVAIASKYAATSVHPPNVNWINPNEVTVEGQQIALPALNQAAADHLEAADRHICSKVLLGISPEVLGFQVTEETHLVDNPRRTDVGYCMFTEPQNPFHKLTLRLAEKSFELRFGVLATGCHRDNKGEPQVTWNDQGALRWLQDYDTAVEYLCVLTMSLGGQSPRGGEHCTAKITNTPFRLRNFFFIGPGYIAEVLMYGKNSSNSGYDSAIARALPWKLGRLFLLLYGLARPIAGLLVERFHGTQHRMVQETSAFALAGVEMESPRLSLLIRKLFSSRLEVDVGIRTLRHLLTAVQRKRVPG